jgi:hypothetical protein
MTGVIKEIKLNKKKAVINELLPDVTTQKAPRYGLLTLIITLHALSLQKCNDSGTCFFSSIYVTLPQKVHKVRSTFVE